MDAYQAYFDANREFWNQRTLVHKRSRFYDLPSFMKGASSLTPIEAGELGDVRGKKILHLQCHFGMDTLSLARLGAEVVGVDLSDQAIAEARQLNEELGLSARFLCCNVYDLPQHLDEDFDIVFTSYGVIGWLPDLKPWASLVRRFLRPGGFFYLAEFHPVIWMMDDDFQRITYHYDNRELIMNVSAGTYTDSDGPPISLPEYSWNHGISEVLNALLGQGLRLEFFNEFSYSPYPCFRHLVQGEDGFWRIRGLEDKLPMVYSLKASCEEGRDQGPG